MHIEEIKELMGAMGEYGVKRLFLEREGCTIELEKPCGTERVHIVEEAVSPVEHKEEKKEFLTSPMVGTLYLAPGPTETSFVKVGDSVEVGQVIAIVEAMKVMNEIKAEKAGRVVAVSQENGALVEYGTPIFQIEPKA